MSSPRQNTIVGTFAVVGVAVLFGLVFMFGGGRSVFADIYKINVHFPEGVPPGVQEGQSVTLHGKRIGETRKIDFWNAENVEEGVRLVVAIDAAYDLPVGSTVQVMSSIMGFGRPGIKLVVGPKPDAGRLPRDGTAEIPGMEFPTLDQVLPKEMQETLAGATQNIGDLARALTPVAEEFRRLLEARDVKEVDVQKLTANLDTVIQRFDAALRHFNTVVGDPDNQANFATMLANLRTGSEKIVTVLDDLHAVRGDAQRSLQDFGALSRGLLATSDELTALTRNMNKTVVALNEGPGTAPLLLRDNRLYEELVLTATRMTKALDELRVVLDMLQKGQLKIKMF